MNQRPVRYERTEHNRTALPRDLEYSTYFLCLQIKFNGAGSSIRTNNVLKRIQIYSLTRPTVFALPAQHGGEDASRTRSTFRYVCFRNRAACQCRTSPKWRKQRESDPQYLAVCPASNGVSLPHAQCFQNGGRDVVRTRMAY